MAFDDVYPAPTTMPYDGNKFLGALSAILACYPLNRAATDKIWATLYAVGAVDTPRMEELATEMLDDYEAGRLAHEGKEALQRWRELEAKDKDQATPEDSSVPPRPSNEEQWKLPASTGTEWNSGPTEDLDVLAPGVYRSLKTCMVGLSGAGKSWYCWATAKELVGSGRRVLYLSEEPRPLIGKKLGTFGLEGAYRDGLLHLLHKSHPDLADKTWAEVTKALAEYVKEHSIDVVFVDTMRPWFSLRGDESNNADFIGPAFDAMSPACEAGAGIVILHQSPWEGKRARNSTEIHAASDVVLHVEGTGNEPRTVTNIKSRDETLKAKWSFKWENGALVDFGNARHSTAIKMANVFDVLRYQDEPMTVAEVVEELNADADKPTTERTATRQLEKLETAGRVIRVRGSFLPGKGQTSDQWHRIDTLTGLFNARGETDHQG